MPPSITTICILEWFNSVRTDAVNTISPAYPGLAHIHAARHGATVNDRLRPRAIGGSVHNLLLDVQQVRHDRIDVIVVEPSARQRCL